MARIVLISPYLKGGQNAAKLAQRTRYVATRPGVELLADERSTLPATKKQQEFIARLLKSFPSCWELIEYEEYLDHPTQDSASAFIHQVQEDYMEALDQKENFIDYISHRPGVQKDGEHGLWDANGKVKNLAQAVREVAEHTGNVWTPVVALRREDAERLGYDNAENWQALVNASICDIAKAYKIRPENLRWYAAFHQKPNQVHIHMIIFSADPKEGYLTKEGIREMKSVFARRIYHADRMHIYQQKDTARQELQEQTRRAMVECIAQLEHLYQALAQLEVAEQALIRADFFLMKTEAECAKAAGISQPGYRKRRDRILRKLRKSLKECAPKDFQEILEKWL